MEPLRFGLEGIGAIPVLAFKTQLDLSAKGGGWVVNLGKTLLVYDKQKIVTIANDGQIRTTVSVTIKNAADFEVNGVDATRPFPLDEGRQFTLTVWHRPQKVRRSVLEIAIAVAENPRGGLAFTCVREGISEDLVFESLDGEDCELHFRDCVVGRAITAVFT